MRVFLFVTVVQLLLSSCTTLEGDITKYSLNEITPGQVFTLSQNIFVSEDWSHDKEYWGVDFYGSYKPSKYAAGVPENLVDYESNKEKYKEPPIKIVGILPKGTSIKFDSILSSGGMDPVIVSICTVLSGEFTGKNVNLMPLFKHNGNFKYYNDEQWLNASQ